MRHLTLPLLATLVLSNLFSLPHKWGLIILTSQKSEKSKHGAWHIWVLTAFSSALLLGVSVSIVCLLLALAQAPSWPANPRPRIWVSWEGFLQPSHSSSFVMRAFPAIKLQAAWKTLEPHFPALKSASSEDRVPVAACKCLFQEGKLL